MHRGGKALSYVTSAILNPELNEGPESSLPSVAKELIKILNAARDLSRPKVKTPLTLRSVLY